FLPEVPTMAESGYNVIVESWLGVFVPAKTPAEVVNALSAAIAEAVKSAPMIDNLAKVGNTATFQTPAEFAATVKADVARWAPVVKASGFVAEDCLSECPGKVGPVFPKRPSANKTSWPRRPQPPSRVRDDRTRRVVTGRPSDAAAGMGARAAVIETPERPAIIGIAER